MVQGFIFAGKEAIPVVYFSVPTKLIFFSESATCWNKTKSFWQHGKHNTGLVQNLGHIIVFLELWAQLFQENLGTR